MPPEIIAVGREVEVEDPKTGEVTIRNEVTYRAMTPQEEAVKAALVRDGATYDLDIPFSARRVTTGAGQAELFRATLQRQTVYDVSLRLMAVDLTPGAGGAVRKVVAGATFKRLDGAAIQVGGPSVPENHADAGAPSMPTLVAVGNDVVISVTGAAGRTIEWAVRGSVNTFTPKGG